MVCMKNATPTETAIAQDFADNVWFSQLKPRGDEQYNKWIASGKTDSLAFAKYLACSRRSADLTDF
jgi:hypothetical protein